MTENQTPDQNHDNGQDDAEGHRIAAFEGAPGARSSDQEPGFVVDVPNGHGEDDAEGHISGARHVDPDVPSAAGDLKAVHPKATDDRMAF